MKLPDTTSLYIERERSLTYALQAECRERATKAMADLDYKNTDITYTTGRAASLAEPGQHEHKMRIGFHAFTLPGRLQLLGYRRPILLIRLSKFLVVGGFGVLVNSLALLLLFQGGHLPLVAASLLAAELAVVNNFYWNDRWTFGRSKLSLSRFARFNLVSLGGLFISTSTLWVLVRHLGFYYLAANLLGIALATAWNFAASLLWTWRGSHAF